ncbi:hypothetical protein BX286_3073 [Streptomyces sp. 3211.6]|uniref:hypothetical protein n=1 Tax=Streptomyces sp. 3211.6 TaxID=1938845 RepID=UPI000C2CBF18|nr:hypothetical protein [Streptomyces sp. 3211.6]RKT05089.1 hypothetical protein BX286_3073 [Streptomyces sp. 3211.6]
MRSRTKSRAASAVAAAAALLGALTACGPSVHRPAAAQPATPAPSTPSPSPASSRSGQEILTEAYETTRKADSMRVAATIQQDGKPMKVDLSLDRKGNCRGEIRVAGLGRLDVVKSSEFVHFRGDRAYWRGTAELQHTPQKRTDQLVAMLADRWVRIPASDPRAAPMTGSCDLTKLTSDLDRPSPLARKGETATVDGKPALAVTSPAKQGTQTDYVATQGKPYILKSTVMGDTTGEALFSAFDVPVDTTSPKDPDILDLSKLDTPPGESI